MLNERDTGAEQTLTLRDLELVISFEIAWNRMTSNKQTLFAAKIEEGKQPVPQRGIPKGEVHALRATKSVNMNPFPVLKISRMDGKPFLQEEEIKLSLVSSHNKLPPSQGSCTCSGNPILAESKPQKLIHRDGETFCIVKGGYLELNKLQIGCCTGTRGHGCLLCLRAEFVSEESLLKGYTIYSLPISVGAKGPFAKCQVLKLKEEQEKKMEYISKESSSPSSFLPSDTISALSDNSKATNNVPENSYKGAQEIINLLNQLNLQKYIGLFLQQEVDLQAFLQLSDSELTHMGITKIGPKVKILKEIYRLKAESDPANALATSDPLTSTDALPKDETLNQWSLSSPLDKYLQDDSQANKRRKIYESPSKQIISDINPQQQVCIYFYMSNIVVAKTRLKKTLFMVKSELNQQDTEVTVQEIQNQLITKLEATNKHIFHEGKAQLMLVLKPDKTGSWMAKSQYTQRLWNFKKGDYIKIDNCHNFDISINVHHYYIPLRQQMGEGSYFEDYKSPKKYPVLFPGGSLQIGVDGNEDGRLALASQLDCEPTETFAVMHNGRLVTDNTYNDTCIFSFKRGI